MKTFDPHILSILAFLPFLVLGWILFFYFDTQFYAFGSFLLCVLFGIGFSRRVFNRTATAKEKHADLQDRAHNPPL